MYPQIEIFSSKLGTFSLCVGLGFALIVFTIYGQVTKRKMCLRDENNVMQAIPLTMACGVPFAVIIDILLRGGLKGFLTPLQYGLTFFGWLAGTIIFLRIYTRIRKLDFIFFLNLFIPAFAGAQAIGRIGCFLGGCCYGRPSSFGFVYPEGSLPYQQFGNVPIFPIQLVESAWLFSVYFVLFFAVKFSYRAGWYLILVSIGRFILEIYRTDDRGHVFGLTVLSPSQVMALCFIAMGIVLILRERKKKAKTLQEQ